MPARKKAQKKKEREMQRRAEQIVYGKEWRRMGDAIANQPLLYEPKKRKPKWPFDEKK